MTVPVLIGVAVTDPFLDYILFPAFTKILQQRNFKSDLLCSKYLHRYIFIRL